MPRPLTGNVLGSLPPELASRPEFTERLAAGAAARVERIVSRGHTSAPGFWYDQAETEWVLLVAGRARLAIEGGGVIELVPGDHVTLAPHQRHRVEWTDPNVDTVWVAVFF